MTDTEAGADTATGADSPPVDSSPVIGQERQLITLDVNGEEYEVITEPRRTLVDVLRHELRLTGTHVGCEHGVCGACTVLLDGRPVRACLMFAAQAEGGAIRTVESLSDGADGSELSDLQRAFRAHHGLQCGFCTPGFLMLAEGFLAERPQATKAEIREVVAANLCRCTGYQSIVEAIDGCAAARREGEEQ
ncbi:(2Fe-2S)-binding protein [Streptomyces sp. x-80]|uniref:(2Fe-2S)-binding protein n=1 Tax=Streptomyces sp. x-80 TaxID=2789282 RepID=UPI003980BF20